MDFTRAPHVMKHVLPFYGLRNRVVMELVLPFYILKNRVIMKYVLPIYVLRNLVVMKLVLPFYALRNRVVMKHVLPFYVLRNRVINPAAWESIEPKLILKVVLIWTRFEVQQHIMLIKAGAIDTHCYLAEGTGDIQ